VNAVFVDTGYLLAVDIANNQNHRAAVEHWQQMTAALQLLVTASYVFDEVVTFFNSRGYHLKAAQVGNNLLHSPSAQFIHVDEALFYKGRSYFQQHHDKDYSPTDYISFTAMRKLGISTAFAFDQHLVQAGFMKRPWGHREEIPGNAVNMENGLMAGSYGCAMPVGTGIAEAAATEPLIRPSRHRPAPHPPR
jgi:predicted nucleic acid-binding protein